MSLVIFSRETNLTLGPPPQHLKARQTTEAHPPRTGTQRTLSSTKVELTRHARIDDRGTRQGAQKNENRSRSTPPLAGGDEPSERRHDARASPYAALRPHVSSSGRAAERAARILRWTHPQLHPGIAGPAQGVTAWRKPSSFRGTGLPIRRGPWLNERLEA